MTFVMDCLAKMNHEDLNPDLPTPSHCVPREGVPQSLSTLDLLQQTELLQVVNAALSAYLERSDWCESMSILLRSALRQTNSHCGMIGIMDRPDGLRVIQESDDVAAGEIATPLPNGTNGAMRKLPKERLMMSELQSWCPRLKGAFESIMHRGTAVIWNSMPVATTASYDAHVWRFLGVPLRCGSQVIGILSVGNSPSEYSSESTARLEALLNHAGVLCDVYLRQEQQRFLEQQRNLAEKRRRESEEELRLLVAGISDYALFTTTPGGMIRSWNPGAKRLFGYSEEEVLGRYFGLLYPSDAVDDGRTEHELRAATTAGRFELEGWRVRKDGSRFWAQGTTTALRDAEGQVRGFARITRDETERKQAEERLRESLVLNQQIIESAQEGIVVFDRELRYRVWNPYMERFSGLSESQVLGKQPYEVFPSLREYGIEQLLQRALSGETIEGEELSFQFEGGRQGWVSAVWSPLRDAQGQINGIIVFTRDITERVGTQRKVRVYYDRLQTLSRRLLSVQEHERRHLACIAHRCLTSRTFSRWRW